MCKEDRGHCLVATNDRTLTLKAANAREDPAGIYSNPADVEHSSKVTFRIHMHSLSWTVDSRRGR